MKLKLFKPEDFFFDAEEHGMHISLAQCADRANQKLNEYIESLTIVYGYLGKGWGPDTDGHDTHTARLVCVEKLQQQKPCKHYAHQADFNNDGIEYFKCLGCGKKLKAKWEVDE